MLSVHEGTGRWHCQGCGRELEQTKTQVLLECGLLLSAHLSLSLLNDVYYSHVLEVAHPRPCAGRFDDYKFFIHAVRHTQVGYPIFCVHHSSDDLFVLSKTCWDRFSKAKFYLREAEDPGQITWSWIDDKARLDGKGPSEVLA
ncbi:hypothetical protein F5Y16DRAFT_354716 [Xylariaceae sp. FL0255]|nr:hypothetical protein F5Y16DRAFT_354716 [Xylariaceae sp. FL0255]